jgi:hypothetical protein
MKTIGEKTFETYLDGRGIRYRFEELQEGKKRPPDYTISHNREYLLEVKDFEPTDVPDAGAYDAYARIRSKIDSAARKFREYEGQPCALVLYNNDARLVEITTPTIVLGAMYGNAGVVIPFDPKTGEAVGKEYQAFLGGGKMIRPHWKNPENTRISALISLRYVDVGQMRLNEYVERIQTAEVGRVRRAADIFSKLMNAELDFDKDERQLGLIVWENAFAAIPFPRDLFNGDYDEIYGFQDGQEPRVYAGPGIIEYDEIRKAAKIPNLFDIIKKSKRKPS